MESVPSFSCFSIESRFAFLNVYRGAIEKMDDQEVVPPEDKRSILGLPWRDRLLPVRLFFIMSGDVKTINGTETIRMKDDNYPRPLFLLKHPGRFFYFFPFFSGASFSSVSTFSSPFSAFSMILAVHSAIFCDPSFLK